MIIMTIEEYSKGPLGRSPFQFLLKGIEVRKRDSRMHYTVPTFFLMLSHNIMGSYVST